MNSEILFTGGAIVVLLFCSALLSGSETSLTAASTPRMHTLAQQGNLRAALVKRLWDEKERLIGAILLGNNLVNILASALATKLLIHLFGDAGVAYATIVMTLLVVIFAEVLPKTFALYDPDRMALAVAPVMRGIMVILKPATLVVQWVTQGIFRLFRLGAPAEGTLSRAEEELRGVIELHAESAEEARHARDMLHSILDLAEVEVSEILTHRAKVMTIDADLPPAKIVEEVLESPHTRLPLWRDKPDNVVGVLHTKALFRAVQQDPTGIDKLDILAIANPPWFIPESTDLLSQLHAFRDRKEHFAIVVDEYGEMLGIVTLEDILEEIVGEIADEHDIELPGVHLDKDGAMVINGEVTIRDLNRQFEWRLPDEGAATIAGLVLNEARRIPEVGQVFVFHGFRFEILERQRNQLTLIKVGPVGEAEDG